MIELIFFVLGCATIFWLVTLIGPKNLFADEPKEIDGDFNEPDELEYDDQSISSAPRPTLGILDSADIARQATNFFDFSLLQRVEGFISPDEMRDAVIELNENLRPQYENLIFDHYRKNFHGIKPSAEQMEREVDGCMDQGFQGLLKTPEIQAMLETASEKTASREIIRSRTWQEIQSDGKGP